MIKKYTIIALLTIHLNIMPIGSTASDSHSILTVQPGPMSAENNNVHGIFSQLIMECFGPVVGIVMGYFGINGLIAVYNDFKAFVAENNKRIAYRDYEYKSYFSVLCSLKLRDISFLHRCLHGSLNHSKKSPIIKKLTASMKSIINPK